MNMRNSILHPLSSILALAVLTLAFLASVASAQLTPEPVIGNIGCTNNVPDNLTDTVNMGSAIDCSRYQEVGVTIKAALTGSGTTAGAFKFVASADGTNYATVSPALLTMTWTPAGTAVVIQSTNFYVGALSKLKLLSITQGSNSAAMTNIAVIYSLKGLRKEFQK
jgi:hypothetical protein